MISTRGAARRMLVICFIIIFTYQCISIVRPALFNSPFCNNFNKILAVCFITVMYYLATTKFFYCKQTYLLIPTINLNYYWHF